MADHRPGRSFPDPASSWFWRDRPEVPHSMRLLHSRCFEWNFRRIKPVTSLCSGWSKIRESSSWSAWPKEIPASASYCFFLPPERGGAFSNSWLHALFNLWSLQRMVWERSQALCSAVLRKSPEHPPLYIDSCRLWFLEAGEFCQRSTDLGSDRLFISAFFPRGMPSWAFEADWKPEFFRPALRKLVKSLKTTLRQAIKPIPKAFFLLWYKNRIL